MSGCELCGRFEGVVVSKLVASVLLTIKKGGSQKARK